MTFVSKKALKVLFICQIIFLSSFLLGSVYLIYICQRESRNKNRRKMQPYNKQAKNSQRIEIIGLSKSPTKNKVEVQEKPKNVIPDQVQRNQKHEIAPEGKAGKKNKNKWLEQWDANEVKKVFQLFDQYGSQWRMFETHFPNRSTNSIKNRFYTALRNTFKLVFRNHQNIDWKFPYEIPSKDLVRLYQGRQQFAKFKDLAKKILLGMGFEYNTQKAKELAGKYSEQIMEIYTIIYEQDKQKEKRFPTDPDMEEQEEQAQQKIKDNINSQLGIQKQIPVINPSLSFINTYPYPPFNPMNQWGFSPVHPMPIGFQPPQTALNSVPVQIVHPNSPHVQQNPPKIPQLGQEIPQKLEPSQHHSQTSYPYYFPYGYKPN